MTQLQMSGAPTHLKEVDPLMILQNEERVIARIRKRRDAGRAKYGTSMERKDIDTLGWINHAQEEAMDFCIYLERLRVQELERTHGEPDREGNH